MKEEEREGGRKGREGGEGRRAVHPLSLGVEYISPIY